MRTTKEFLGFVFAVSLGVACSAGDAMPIADAGPATGAETGPEGAPDARAEGGGNADSSASPPGPDGGGAWNDGPAPGPCDTYATKAYACCQASASCGSYTRDTLLAYCAQFYKGCGKYYACYLGAPDCATAANCPTLGNGGCS
jgi:hypothetical protein